MRWLLDGQHCVNQTCPLPRGPLGAVYDPISGLVITSTNRGGEDWELWTYDVDTDAWAQLGTVTVDRDTPCCTQIDLDGLRSSHRHRNRASSPAATT